MEKHGRKSGGHAKEEFHKFMESRNRVADSLVEEWDIDEFDLADIMDSDPHKARNIAIGLTMQEDHMQTMNETIISTTFSTKPENVLKIIRIGIANSNRGNFATEYQLQTTDDAFYHIDMTYEDDYNNAANAYRNNGSGQKLYENINPYHAGESVRVTLDANGAGTTYDINPTTAINYNSAIVPFSVRVIVGGAIVGNDDGSGNLTFTGIDTTGTNTVIYTTGRFQLAFLVAPSVAIEVLFNWNSEDSTKYQYFGHVGISLTKTRFNARPHPLGYSYSAMTELMLGTTLGQSADDLLLGAAGDEHAKARDYKAIAKIRMVALNNGTEYFDTDYAGAGEISDESHAQKIMSKIKEIGGVIYDDIKRGQINKAIAGSQALVYLMKHDQWKDDITQDRTGVYFAGRLGDIDVFACPADPNLVANNEILLTYKNAQEGLDVGIVFGVLTEISATLAYPEFYTVSNIASVEDDQVINDKFMRLLVLQNL